MVDDDLMNLHKPGMAVHALLAGYRALGDDPFIVPVDGAAAIDFSAWSYAEERCGDICGWLRGLVTAWRSDPGLRCRSVCDC